MNPSAHMPEVSKPSIYKTLIPVLSISSVDSGELLLFLMLFYIAKRSQLKFTQLLCKSKETHPTPQTRHLPKLPVSRMHLFAMSLTPQGTEDANCVDLETVPQVCVCVCVSWRWVVGKQCEYTGMLQLAQSQAGSHLFPP